MKHMMKHPRRPFNLIHSIKFMGPPLVYAILMLFHPVANATISLDADWEYGTFEDFKFKVSKNDYGVEIVDGPSTGAPTCSGTKSLKSELIYGKGTAWSQLVLNQDPYNSFANKTEHWFAFAVYLPEDFVPDTHQEMIWELHGRPDSEDGELSRNAPVAIRIKNDQWLISYIKDSNYITYKAGDAKKVYEESKAITVGKYETGKWTVFVINTLYDYTPSGYLKIWKDDELIINKTNGIGFNDNRGPFVRMGLYKAVWRTDQSWSAPTTVSSRTIYMDDFRVGDANTTYEEIVPKCNNSSLGTPIVLTPPTGLNLQVW